MKHARKSKKLTRFDIYSFAFTVTVMTARFDEEKQV